MFEPKQAQEQEAEIARKKAEAERRASKKLNQSVDITREYIEDEKAFRRGVVSIKNLISPASMKINPDYLILGDKFVRTIFVINYPRYISVGWFAPIINLNSTFDVAMFFYPVESGVILKQLKKKVGGLEAQIISDAEKAPRAIPCARPRSAILRLCATL